MSATLTSPTRPDAGPIKRALRRLWLAYRITQAERDHAALCEQIQRDLRQVEAYSAQIDEWRAELAFSQEPMTEEGPR
jgi:hypothetical protein